MDARPTLLLLVVALLDCGPSEPARSAAPGRTPEREETTEAPPRAAGGPTAKRVSASSGIEVEGEVGGLNQEAVDAVVTSAGGAIDACWERGTEQNELIAGTIQLTLGIGGQGRPAYAFVAQSTLGDARVERCMLDALSAKTWPKPVGGKVGVVRTNFAFELPKGARGPATWSSTRVSDVVAGLTTEIAACKSGASGSLTATVYLKQLELPPPPIDADAGDAAGEAGDAGPTLVGAAISVGIASSDERAAAAVACLERVLSRATYPAPGDWPAKVTFEL